ncbi:unnamed protein product, partial [Phaeothamnion confervicola]
LFSVLLRRVNVFVTRLRSFWGSSVRAICKRRRPRNRRGVGASNLFRPSFSCGGRDVFLLISFSEAAFRFLLKHLAGRILERRPVPVYGLLVRPNSLYNRRCRLYHCRRHRNRRRYPLPLSP